MTAKYWIAKYISNPFRNETSNVGVFVAANAGIAARFVGERDDGTLDNRSLSRFSHPAVYKQWRDYWRKQLRNDLIDSITNIKTQNYYVELGGEVADIGADSAADICSFMYNLLVGNGADEAYGWNAEDEIEIRLETDIVKELKNFHVLSGDDALTVRHPIMMGRQIKGKNVAHTPSFSQMNGALHVMEYIDFSSPRKNVLKQRAGWMAYMFSDIKETNAGSNTYSIIRPDNIDGVEQIEYAKALLSEQSHIINWADERAKNEFLASRRVIADMPAH